ncbi:Pvc16 family protein [Paeniglutamicibacter psychrophenolicus]|uniref:Pvc16 N-terminal domain-containing protein n=1 Tax=Paeniglutamicibacter psychrophenolicus TaxID=257454 RepID=A0ABS4WG15_9MICC|nr:hypothetical protein [Paeniglutamicibacter psychrophenolicus]
MSDFSIVHDVGLELRRGIFEALSSTPDTDFGLAGNIERISLQSPAADLDDETLATLYLYRFGISPFLRNQHPLPDAEDPGAFHHPPLPLQLHFLFTPVSKEETTNLLLFGRVLQHLHDSATMSSINGEPLDDSHSGASPALRVSPEPLEPEALYGLWTAFTTPVRLGTGIRVETVAIDSALPAEHLARTRTMATALGLSGRQP